MRLKLHPHTSPHVQKSTVELGRLLVHSLQREYLHVFSPSAGVTVTLLPNYKSTKKRCRTNQMEDLEAFKKSICNIKKHTLYTLKLMSLKMLMYSTENYASALMKVILKLALK